ncbi:MAG: CBS domain-containing protein [Acidobacteriia bacterium]|nr:CBS domain-containing protein [Terriglobia bacterium]
MSLDRPRRAAMSGEYRVQDIMTGAPVTIEASAKLLDAALLLRSASIRHLLVVEGETLVGILSDRDLQRYAPSRLVSITEQEYNAVFTSTLVGRVMTPNPRTISPTATLLEAIAVFQELRHGCLPVVNGARLVGILTRWDLVEAFRQVLNGEPVGRRG